MYARVPHMPLARPPERIAWHWFAQFLPLRTDRGAFDGHCGEKYFAPQNFNSRALSSVRRNAHAELRSHNV